MKKLLIVIAVLSSCLSFYACGTRTKPAENRPTTGGTQQDTISVQALRDTSGKR